MTAKADVYYDVDAGEWVGRQEPSQALTLLTSQGSEERYTPPEILRVVRAVLGTIDLDPATCEFAQELLISATQHFTKETDGLATKWPKVDTVFLNPPYGTRRGESLQGTWLTKMEAEFRCGTFQSGIALVNANLGYKWFEYFYRYYPCCLASELIHFLDVDGDDTGPAKKASCFLLFHRTPEMLATFTREFGHIGHVLEPWMRHE